MRCRPRNKACKCLNQIFQHFCCTILPSNYLASPQFNSSSLHGLPMCDRQLTRSYRTRGQTWCIQIVHKIQSFGAMSSSTFYYCMITLQHHSTMFERAPVDSFLLVKHGGGLSVSHSGRQPTLQVGPELSASVEYLET